MPESEKKVDTSTSFESFAKRLKTRREESEQARNERAARMEFYRRVRRR